MIAIAASNLRRSGILDAIANNDRDTERQLKFNTGCGLCLFIQMRCGPMSAQCQWTAILQVSKFSKDTWQLMRS